jgi:hypothetical protein
VANSNTAGTDAAKDSCQIQFIHHGNTGRERNPLIGLALKKNPSLQTCQKFTS